jgi:hypothetical protein
MCSEKRINTLLDQAHADETSPAARAPEIDQLLHAIRQNHRVSRCDTAGDDMAGEDAAKPGFVFRFAQIIESRLMQFGKRLVGWREHSERSLLLERCDKSRGLKGLRQGLERSGSDGSVDDVLAGGLCVREPIMAAATTPIALCLNMNSLLVTLNNPDYLVARGAVRR